MYFESVLRANIAVLVDKKNNNIPKVKDRPLLDYYFIYNLLAALALGMNERYPVRCLHYLNSGRPKVKSIFDTPKLPATMTIIEMGDFYNSEEETYGYIGFEYNDGSCHVFNYLNPESKYYFNLDK